MVEKQQWDKCSEIGNTQAVESLEVALQDKESSVRKAAAIALGQIGDPQAIESLHAALRDKQPGVRKAVAIALGQIGDSRSKEPLEAALLEEPSSLISMAKQAGDTILGVRKSIIKSLEQIEKAQD